VAGRIEALTHSAAIHPAVAIKSAPCRDPAAASYGTEGHDETVMVDPGALIAEFGDPEVNSPWDGG